MNHTEARSLDHSGSALLRQNEGPNMKLIFKNYFKII